MVNQGTLYCSFQEYGDSAKARREFGGDSEDEDEEEIFDSPNPKLSAGE